MRHCLIAWCIVVCSFVTLAQVPAQHPAFNRHQTEIPSADPAPLCGSPEVSDSTLRLKAIENTRILSPQVYREMTEQALRETPQGTADTVGSQKRFFVYNFQQTRYDQVNATLLLIGRLTKIWVDNNELALQHVTQVEVEKIRTTLEDQSPATSRNPGEGIVALDQQYFGLPPNISPSGIIDSGDGKTTFLVTDIKDGWDSTSTSGYVAGFFSSNDQIVNNPGSNQCDMLYIDSYPGIYHRGNRDPEKPLDVLAHEYQHLIEYRYDQLEQAWVNEGLSEYAEVVTGFPLRNPVKYFSNANVPLSRWSANSSPKVLDDYSRVALWTLYTAEQDGDEYIRRLVQNPLHGIEGVNDAAAVSGAPFGFTDLFQNWLVANILNDRSVDGRYGYRYPIVGQPALNNTDITNPNASASSMVIENLAGHYIEFAFADSLHILFSRQSGSLSTGLTAIETGIEGSRISTLSFGVPTVYPEFGSNYYQLIFVVGNLSPSQQFIYSYSSTGLQSYVQNELKYDDGQPVPYSGSSSLFGFGNNKPGYGMAVKFQAANPRNSLIGAKLYIAFDNELSGSPYPADGKKSFEFHVWGDSGGIPSRNLIPPIPVTVDRPAFPDDFYSIGLLPYRSSLTDLAAPVYIGFTQSELDTIGIYGGMSNATPTNYTYALYGPGSPTTPDSWVPLSAVRTSNGASLSGFNMMFRALFLYKGADQGGGSTAAYRVSQTYPNPYLAAAQSEVVHIPFHVAGNAQVELSIYDILGRRVTTIHAIAPASGSDEFIWDGSNAVGQSVSSGIYFYKISSDGWSGVGKMVIVE